LGDAKLVQDDAMNGTKHNGIIIDHCSMSWSVDESASFYDNTDFTMQYCIISESLYNSIHEKGPHGYGGIWGGKGATFHHNLIAHHTSRNPRFCGSRYSNQPASELIDFRNNVIFNWGSNSIYGAEGGSYNLVNNYFKSGPATKSSVKSRIIAPNADDGTNDQPLGVWGKFFVEGNYVAGYENVTVNNWVGVHVNSGNVAQIKSTNEFACENVTTQNAELAFEHVMAQAGCALPQRDAVDNRVIQEALSGIPTFGSTWGAGTGIIDSQNDVGGWPLANSGMPVIDTDHDGMPDDWELAHGLNINNTEDRNEDANGDGYTNLEDFLNELVEQHTYLIRPLNFKVKSIGTTKVELSWDDVTDNESGFLMERKKNTGEFLPIADLPANTVSFTDEDISNDVFSYRLRAKNEADTSFYTDTVQIDFLTHSGSLNQLIDTFSIYPNPFQNQVIIDFNSLQFNDVKIDLYNAFGQNMFTFIQPKNSQIRIETSSFPIGIYLLVISTCNSFETKKLIKT